MAIVNSLGTQELAYLSSMSAGQGYQVLNKGMAQAVTNFEKTPQAQSDISYFEQNIGKAKSVTDFLSNTRLVDFVLSAFGLDQEANYQGLVKAVLTQDPSSPKSLVNQLTDPRFKQMATALDFFDNGLGALQAVGLPMPKGASSAEGVTLDPTLGTKAKSTSSLTLGAAPQAPPATTTTTSINSSITLGIGVTTVGNQYLTVQEPAGTSNTIGIGMSDNEYLQVTEADGTTGYTKSGSFTLNSSGQLALSDGSVLQPALTFPTGTTSVNVTSGGVIQAFVNGSTTATVVGQLQTTTFTDATQLTKDANGYYNATAGSGTGTAAASTGTVSTAGATAYTQSGYFTVNSNGQLQTANGGILLPPVAVPSNATSLVITDQGVVEANTLGQNIPTVLGQLKTASFTDQSSLTQDSMGNYQATTASGAAVTTAPTGGVSTYGANSNLITTTVKSTVGSSSSSALGVGFAISGNDYLILQKTDGTKVYTKSAYFTLNSDNQLALPDGTTLVPSISFPSDTTAITITSKGAIYAQEKGKTAPTSVGQLETATFATPAKLAHDPVTGYYTPTTASGAATVSFQSGKSTAFSSTIQSLVNSYVQNEFEIAVGNNNAGVREALYFQRTVGPNEASVSTYNLATKADVILGDSVLLDVAETVLGQPKQIAYQSLSSQEKILEKGLQLTNFQDKKYVASLTARYLTIYDASHASSTETSNSPALQILSAFSSGNSGSSSSSNSGSSLISLLT